MTLRATLLAAGLLAAATPLYAQERSVTLQAQQGLTLTLYQDGLGLVHDNRWVPLVPGENRLAITGISERLIGGSLALQAAGEEEAGALRLLEQSLLPADLTPYELLRRAVGQRVQLVSTDAEGRERSESATLLSMAAGPVLRVGERIEIDPPGRIVLLDLPDGLRAEPQLALTLQAEEAGARELVFAYLSEGLSWRTDYVATLAEDGESLRLEGWATLVNETAAPFERARLRLVAGSVARGPSEEPYPAPMMLRAAVPEMAMAYDEMPAAVAVADRYLYDTGREVDLMPGERKRLSLFQEPAVPATRRYRFEGLVSAGGPDRQGPVNAALILEFANEGDFARPLPRGTVRVYEPAGEGPALFAGESAIAHTPVGGELSLRLGEAFDITAEARQTAYERLSDRSYEAAGAVTLRNAKEEAVEVQVAGSLPRGARILQESAPHEAESATLPVWTLTVPAGGELELTYRIRVN